MALNLDQATADFGEGISLRFGDTFMADHAGRLMTDPRVALVELVSNSWDAGADTVEIRWPDVSHEMNFAPMERISIVDNGHGMTQAEFLQRWTQLSYNRSRVQGEYAQIPGDNRQSTRRTYGRNGKGRHGLFCFSNEYRVITWRDGSENTFRVSLDGSSVRNQPVKIVLEKTQERPGHGTEVQTNLIRHPLSLSEVTQLIVSRFALDPQFEIRINGSRVELHDIGDAISMHEIQIGDLGTIKVSLVHSPNTGRTSDQHGVVWWVNRKKVGSSSWRDGDEYVLLDARLSAAKQYSFVVEADILLPFVEPDWSSLRPSKEVDAVKEAVRVHVIYTLNELFKDRFKANKREVVARHVKGIAKLSLGSRKYIGQFLDEVQEQVANVDTKVLAAALVVLTNLEQSRSGYALIEKLARLDPNDLDALNSILESWTVQEARLVLDELGRRLNIIEAISKLMDDPDTDELRQLQPLFEHALWMFGPEYEGISFTSNKTLTTTVRKLFPEGDVAALKSPSVNRKRAFSDHWLCEKAQQKPKARVQTISQHMGSR